MALEERHKFGYLTDEIVQPRPEDPQERIWKGKDSRIRSLLITVWNPKLESPSCMLQLLKRFEIQFNSYTLKDKTHPTYIP